MKKEKESLLDKPIIIHPPIKIIPSKIYNLIIQDSTGKFHYFEKNGTYDGWSIKLNYSLN